jgi:hypothetical protein
MESFLLVDRAGHCEYFASASVLLLRGLGIPARYVTGYSVQEYSRLEEAFLVRQRHAHAWAEAYVDGRWVEVDSTPSTWLDAEEQHAPFWQPVSDLFSYVWQRLGEWRQTLHGGDILFPAATIGATLLLALAWFLRLRLRRASAPATARNPEGSATTRATAAERNALRLLETEFAALGLPRHATEPPRSWIKRVGKDGGTVVKESDLARANAIVAAFYRHRYGPPPASEY